MQNVNKRFVFYPQHSTYYGNMGCHICKRNTKLGMLCPAVKNWASFQKMKLSKQQVNKKQIAPRLKASDKFCSCTLSSQHPRFLADHWSVNPILYKRLLMPITLLIPHCIFKPSYGLVNYVIFKLHTYRISLNKVRGH
jgi:hypothetical protein